MLITEERSSRTDGEDDLSVRVMGDDDLWVKPLKVFMVKIPST